MIEKQIYFWKKTVVNSILEFVGFIKAFLALSLSLSLSLSSKQARTHTLSLTFNTLTPTHSKLKPHYTFTLVNSNLKIVRIPSDRFEQKTNFSFNFSPQKCFWETLRSKITAWTDKVRSSQSFEKKAFGQLCLIFDPRSRDPRVWEPAPVSSCCCRFASKTTIYNQIEF